MEKKTSKTQKFNLYRKEQFVLGIILLCFALSGIGLPKLNDHLHPAAPPVDNTVETTTQDNSAGLSSSEVEDEHTESDVPNSQETVEDTTTESESFIDADIPESSESSNSSSSIPSSSKPSKEPTTETPKEPEKIWVPPVYEIVHHEAVYETIRVVICNYCSQEFGTVGEFQVHKDAHGG